MSEPTDAQKESALDMQDKQELASFRKIVKDADAAQSTRFTGRKRGMGNLQTYELLGKNDTIILHTFGFISDEAVALADKHLDSYDAG